MASTDPRADYPLARKLAQFVRLSSQDLDIIEELRSADDRHAADVELVSEGDVPRSVFLLKQGMAFRYRLLADGSCQILTFMIWAISATRIVFYCGGGTILFVP